MSDQIWVDIFGQGRIQYVPIDNSDTPFEIYQDISKNYTHSFLFESLAGPDVIAETSIMGFDPKVVVSAYADHIVITNRDAQSTTRKCNDPLLEIRKMLASDQSDKYRYTGGAVGTVDYDAAGLWENVAHPDVDKMIMEFGIYTDGILYDHVKKTPFYFYRENNRYDMLKRGGIVGDFSSTKPTSTVDNAKFSKMVERAKKYIISGDVFQVVLSRKYTFDTSGDPLKVYEKLRALNPSPYLYHVKMNARTIIGASPEMLLRVDADVVETFPIAGTRKVTGSKKEDLRRGKEMLSNEKELAEHTMLVDLGRNDVGKVCAPGSVSVKDLMSIKQFSHVQHMVSHVQGKISTDKDMFDAFKAIFPAGTVSGAPKVRAMEIIDELETERRGPYAGAVGYFSFNQCCDFAIAIRSIFFDGKKGFVQAGAGIVYDSDPTFEFEETAHKAKAMLTALEEASK